MTTKRQSPYTGSSDGTSFTIHNGDRKYPFSSSQEEIISYEFTNSWKDADILLHLTLGWAFIAKVTDGNIEKSELQINPENLDLDGGFYLLKEKPGGTARLKL